MFSPTYLPVPGGILHADSTGSLSSPLTPPAISERADGGVEELADEGDGATRGFFHVAPEVRVYFRAVGSGSKPVLVLHGGPGAPPSDAGWAGVEELAASPLAEEFRFYYLHQRGCGRSTRFFNNLKSKSYPAAMEALLRVLGLQEQVADLERIRRILEAKHGNGQVLQAAILGHSFGGLISALYAAEFGDVVDKVVLESPAAMLVFPPPDESTDTFAIIRSSFSDNEEMLAEFAEFEREYTDYGSLFERTEEDLLRTNAKFLTYYSHALKIRGVTAPQLDSGADGSVGDGLGGWVGPGIFMSMGMFGFDCRSAVSQTTADVLILEGAQDLVGAPHYKEAYGSRARVVVAEGAGHFLHEEGVALFVQSVGEFLRST